MVSPLSSRLLGLHRPSQEDGLTSFDNKSNSSRHSSKSAGSSSNGGGAGGTNNSQKRPFYNGSADGVTSTWSNSISNNTTSKSISGYSADREGTTAVAFPPGVVSVHRHGSITGSSSGVGITTATNNMTSNSNDSTGSSSSSRRHHYHHYSHNCPKRRKSNESAFAVSSLKTDLERGGMKLKKVEKNEGDTITFNDGISIPLKGVQLVSSNRVNGPFLLPLSGAGRINNVSATTSMSEYETLARTVQDLYPLEQPCDTTMGGTAENNGPQRNQLLKPFRTTSQQVNGRDNGSRSLVNDAASDSSTSSVSDTESDSFSDSGNNTGGSGSDNAADSVGSRTSSQGRQVNTLSGSNSNRSLSNASSSQSRTSGGNRSTRSSRSGSNNRKKSPILVIPPLLENSSSAAKKPLERCSKDTSNPCNVISCASTAVTMAEMLQISSEARLVTKSTAPFSVVHANAAFLRMVSKDGSKGVIGSPFSALLDRDTTPEMLSLMDCMVSSSMGCDTKLSVSTGSDNQTQGQINNDQTTTDNSTHVECSVCVSPIFASKSESCGVTSVTHFAIELHRNNGLDTDQLSIGSGHRSPIQAAMNVDTMPMEVMG